VGEGGHWPNNNIPSLPWLSIIPSFADLNTITGRIWAKLKEKNIRNRGVNTNSLDRLFRYFRLCEFELDILLKELKTKRLLVAVIACRNSGSRLYGKPLQRLDVNSGVTILENIIENVRLCSEVGEIVVAAADEVNSQIYRKVAKELGVEFVEGDEENVLSRLILGGEHVSGTDVLRLSSESPFPHFEPLKELWESHCLENADATFLDGLIDGCGFEILNVKSMRRILDFCNSAELEHCSQYFRTNRNKFTLIRRMAEPELFRKNMRLTVDYPEDLIVCRAVYKKFKKLAPAPGLDNIISFLDENKSLLKWIEPYTDKGYSSMYKW